MLLKRFAFQTFPDFRPRRLPGKYLLGLDLLIYSPSIYYVVHTCNSPDFRMPVKKIISLFAVVARTRTHSEFLAGIPPNLDPFPYMWI